MMERLFSLKIYSQTGNTKHIETDRKINPLIDGGGEPGESS